MHTNIIYPKKYEVFYNILSLALRECLESLDYTVDINYSINQTASDMEIVLCPLNYGTSFVKKTDRIYVMYQQEQFPTEDYTSDWQKSKWDRTLSMLHMYDVIWDTFFSSHEKLYKVKNLKVIGFDLGYHELFDKQNESKQLYDVSFLGSNSNRRTNVLSKLKKFNVVFEKSTDEKGRENLIDASKINLNIHYDVSILLETLRVIVFMLSRGSFVLTEDFIGYEYLKEKKCLVIAKSEHFAGMIDYYLKNEAERKEIAKNGYQYIKNNIKLIDSVKKCIQNM